MDNSKYTIIYFLIAIAIGIGILSIILQFINRRRTGPKGDKGDKGDQGNIGDKGDKGDTATLTVEQQTNLDSVAQLATNVQSLSSKQDALDTQVLDLNNSTVKINTQYKFESNDGVIVKIVPFT